MKKILGGLAAFCLSTFAIADENTVYITNNSVMPYSVSVVYSVCQIETNQSGIHPVCGPLVDTNTILIPGNMLSIPNIKQFKQQVNIQAIKIDYQGKKVVIPLIPNSSCSDLFPGDMAVIVAAGTPPVAKCSDFTSAQH